MKNTLCPAFEKNARSPLCTMLPFKSYINISRKRFKNDIHVEKTTLLSIYTTKYRKPKCKK